MQQPRAYHTDELKVALVGSLLTGSALAWFSPLFEDNNACLTDFANFVELLRARFEDPSRRKNAAARLLNLRQSSRTTAAFATEFQLLLADAGTDDATARFLFRRALNDDIQDLLMVFDEQNSLAALIKDAITVDHRLQHRRLSKVSYPSPPPNGRSAGFTTSFPRRYVTANPQTSPPTPIVLPPPITAPAGVQGVAPMIIDAAVSTGPRPRLTDEQRRFRQENNLCMYCGDKDHVVANCPPLSRRNQGNAYGH
jgi:Retrotransposon gag protein